MWRFVCMFMIMLIALAPGKGETSAYSERIAAMAEVKAVRIAAEADHVRVVVDTTKEVEYSTFALNEPSRLVIDIKGAWVGQNVSRETLINSPFVSRLRIGQHSQDTVRLVVETEVGKEKMNIFPLPGGNAGYRVVMDFGKPAKATGESKNEAIKPVEQNPNPDIGDMNQPEGENERTGNDIQTEDNKDDNKESKKEIKKRTKGLKGKTIVIDPGHGGEDAGAIGPSGVMEKSITLQVATQLQELLEDADVEVVMTRTTDTEVSPKHRQATDIDELQARCDVANKAKADMFISIHMDSFTNATAKGTTGYYYAKGTADSKRLAAAVQSNLISRLGTESRGVKTCNFYVVKHTTMPATLIEVAFVSNPAEEKLMTSSAGIKKAARGIFDGIAEFFAK